MSETGAFPRALLRHRYPGVALHGDFTTIRADEYGAVDVLVGGTPCKSISISGVGRDLDEDCRKLAIEYIRLVGRVRPRWVVFENVPRLLSLDEGRVFGAFVGRLAEFGYGWAYRVLDAQYFGLAQRRKRVFVIAHLGDWRRAAAVLFEPKSLRWHPAPVREEGETVAPTLGSRGSGGGGLGTDFDLDGGLIEVSGWPSNQEGGAVRRLTPRECERLQGFPDDYTLVPYRRKLAADQPRYRALGNSMAVPVLGWIGRRMALQ